MPVSDALLASWRESAARDANRFARTEYVVDATDDEQQTLWWRYHEHYRVPWEEDSSRGFMDSIAMVAIRDPYQALKADFKADVLPIAVCVFWARIGPAWIAFVHATSLLVHHGLVRAWQNAVFPCLSLSMRHSDAANFGRVINDIIERHGLTRASIYQRDPGALSRAYEIDERATHDLHANPQAAHEWAEAKVQEWGVRAERWRLEADPTATRSTSLQPPARRTVKAPCAHCFGGQVTRSDGFGGKWQERCQQCRGHGICEVLV